jgi:hypothetical protein
VLTLIDDDGVGPVEFEPRSGGWAQHGYDDSADMSEREA